MMCLRVVEWCLRVERISESDLIKCEMDGKSYSMHVCLLVVIAHAIEARSLALRSCCRSTLGRMKVAASLCAQHHTIVAFIWNYRGLE